MEPGLIDTRLCYSPGFHFTVNRGGFRQSLGFPPKISTTVENTVENMVNG